jgi:glycosyltransferase involved in cell wall biosynthesis
MKILLVSSSSGSRGGGELYLLYLGRALAERGHAVTLWTSTHPRMDELANSFSSFGEVIRARYKNIYDRPGRSLISHFDLWGAARIGLQWRRSGYDVIHVNKQNLEDGLDLLRATRFSGKPSLCTIHLTQDARYLTARFAGMRDRVARQALRQYSGLLVTVLESRRRDLLAFLGPSPRVRFVSNGVPLYDLAQRETLRAGRRAELGITSDQFLFLGVGRMVSQKRPLRFLEEAAHALRIMPGARFVWVGDGPLSEEWDAAVAERRLGAAVQRLPWQMDVLPLLFAADALLHVAEFEGLPLAILEALSAGLPCALTPNLLEEMPFFNQENSRRVEGEGAWSRDFADPVKLGRMSVAARRLAEREFSYTRMAEEYEMLYELTRRSEA